MHILDIIFSKRCVGCGRSGKYFCAVCRTKIRVIKPNEPVCPMCGRAALDGITHPKCRVRYSLDGLISFFHYDGPIRKAIKSIKYRRVSDLAEEFVSLVSINADSRLRGNDIILIPSPLRQNRFRDRVFNQAEKLGMIIAKRLNIPLRTDILRRVKETTPQVEMKDKKKRLENMQNVFSIHNSSILLFDDVFTTGATMRNAASVLKRGGAGRVWAVTMAR
jgi:ComF family protein